MSGLLACSGAKPVPPPDPHKIVYPNKFTAKLPSPRWQRMANSRELKLYNPKLVNLYFKKNSGSVILVRSGRRIEFGVPPDYDLTNGQLIYLVKFLPKGDFIGREEFESSNPLLERAKNLVKFKVKHPQLGPGQITATVIHRGELLLIEFFAPQAALAADEPEFYLFLDSLQEAKKE
jgi:hypothetical protein